MMLLKDATTDTAKDAVTKDEAVTPGASGIDTVWRT